MVNDKKTLRKVVEALIGSLAECQRPKCKHYAHCAISHTRTQATTGLWMRGAMIKFTNRFNSSAANKNYQSSASTIYIVLPFELDQFSPSAVNSGKYALSLIINTMNEMQTKCNCKRLQVKTFQKVQNVCDFPLSFIVAQYSIFGCMHTRSHRNCSCF